MTSLDTHIQAASLPGLPGLPGLPDNWRWVRFADFCERVSVGHVGPTTKHFVASGTGVPLIRSQNVRPGKLVLDDIIEISTDFHAKLKKSQLRSGDVLVVRVGANRSDCCVVPEGVGPINCANIVFARPQDSGKFFSYYFNTTFGRKMLLGATTGAAQEVINTKSVADTPVPLPPPDVRERIEGVLSAYDELIENNRRRIALLEQAARLLYREWFVHFRFPGYETVKFVDGLPEGWTHELLSDLCTEGDGIQTGPFGSQLHQSDYTDEGVPVVMPKDMKSGKVDCDGIARIPEALADKLGRHRMLPGDTVFGRRGEIGRKAFIGENQRGFFCGTGCLRIRPIAEKIDPRYLFETLGSPATAGFIVNQAKGSTMPNLSAGALKNVPILCPPDDIQADYVQKSAPIFEQVEILDRKNVQLAKARDLLLPRLMDGRLSIPE